MLRFDITGMSCAACSSHVEKAVKAVAGVNSCSVNLLTNSMEVDGSASPEIIIAAVEKAGYGAAVKGEKTAQKDGSHAEEKVLRQRLVSSVVLLLILMYFSMGYTMWGFPLPAFFDGNHTALGLVQLLITVMIMVINQKFFISGFKGLVNRSPNMDTLVALGASAAFIYSTFVLFEMTAHDAVSAGHMTDFYFESAGTILTLITVGKALEARSKGRTTDALKSLISLAPKTAVILKDDGTEETIPADSVKKGDIFVVRPGDSIPADGIVLEGSSAVNESALTGESIPVDKNAGDSVSAATINQSGFLKCEAVRVGEDTALSEIIRMVTESSSTKAPIAKTADRVSGVFVPVVMSVAAVTFAVWLIAGESVGFSLARAISVLVISCPCALGLATPVAIMVGSGIGAKNGILFKTAAALEAAGRTEIVILDKTGTITTGKPSVTDVIPCDDISESELTETACSVEKKSEHPLAGAVVEYGEKIGAVFHASEDFAAHAGSGVSAVIKGERIYGGNLKFISEYVKVSKEMSDRAEKLSKQGKTPLFFACDKRLLGIIAVCDIIKEDSKEAVSRLKNMGMRVVMLTGDNERTAAAIAAQTGIDEIIAGVLPDGKENVVKKLSKEGKTAMVGDGINDAPALTRAETGIALGAGTDVAVDAADVVLMNSRLCDVPAAIRLGRAVLRNIRQNLFWAFIYNLIGIPLASGVWIPVFGLKLSPMFGAAAMSLSSFCVVTNALRLNLIDIKSPARDKYIKQRPKKEEKTMTKTMKIEGMMCGHCEAAVKKALEAVAGVESAEVSHEKGTAVLTLSVDVDNAVLKKTVEDKDYTVISID